jgi:hypothetical protein
MVGLRKPKKTSFRIAGTLTGIGTRHLQSTNQKTLRSEPVWPVYRCCSHVRLSRRENKLGLVGSGTAAIRPAASTDGARVMQI